MRTYGVYDGTLGIWFDQGLGGIQWVLQCDHPSDDLPYGNLVPLENGDILSVQAADGREAGRLLCVRTDFERDWRPYPQGVQGLHGKSRLNPFAWLWYRWRHHCAVHWEELSPATRRLMRRYLSGQPAAGNYWVRWTIRTMPAQEWAALFLPRQGKAPYRACLWRRKDA